MSRKLKKSVKRLLTEDEIKDILSYITPNKYIPVDTAEQIVKQTRLQISTSLANVQIYPELIPKLREKILKSYKSTLIQPGECVGIIMAQSIGEKQTQANLNSVDWKEVMIYTEAGSAKIEPIGQLIDNILLQADKNSIQFFPESHTEYLEIKEKNMYIPSCDYNGKCGWFHIEAVTRHYPVGKLVKVTTQSGRVVTATQAKSFLVWDGAKFEPTNGSDLKVGDFLPTTHTLPFFKDVKSTFNLRTIFPPTEYVYTTELIKARDCRHSEWSEKNGKDFILPFKRKDTCFGKRKDYYMSCEPGLVYLTQEREIQKSKVFVSHFLEDVELDEDFGFLVGIYLAEGLVTKTFMCISNNDAGIRKRVTDYCDKFGVTYHLVISKGKNVRNGTSSDLKLHSCILARLFKSICDTGSLNKRVPEFAYTAPKKFIKGLLDGYFSGDGTVDKDDGSVGASSISEQLILGISFLLSYFGIFGRLSNYQQQKNNVGSKNIHRAYKLNISNGFAQKFATEIPMTHPLKSERLEKITLSKDYRYIRGRSQEGFPPTDVYFDQVKEIEFVDGTTEYVYDFTVAQTRNFQGINGLNFSDTFHKCGSSDKQPVVSKFSELLNATNKPKAPSYFVYFKEGNSTVTELRNTIGHSIIQLTFKKITKSFKICVDKEEEAWYEAFRILNDISEFQYTDCVSLQINTDILYEYKITTRDISDYISREYSDLYCVYSPDCYGQIDIFVDTSNIDLPEDKLIFVTKDNAREIYLEEVVQPIIENIVLCGIPGIMTMYFLEDKSSKTWYIETENSREKIIESVKFKNTKDKPTDSIKRFKKILAHPTVDMTKTISNNVWDIYHTLGVEAVRQYMIDEFSKIMEGINLCHVMLLVDKMTNGGSISSISRYTMRREDTGVLARSSFEETLDNLLGAGVHGQEDPTRGVSASIICGKRAKIGTGLCEVSVDLNKLIPISETDENSSD
jgi:DNA-directed RNA polymerase subunit A"